MIDIRELRRNPEAYLAKLARKGAGELGQELLDLDAAWRATTTSAESLRAKLKSSGKPTAEQREELQRAKEQFQETESKLAELEARRRALLDRLPNPPADDVPSGGEEDFEVLREMGTKPSFAFTARDHLDLAQPHGWLDAPRGTKASGSRFVYRLGDLALLEMALYRYAFTRVTEQGHIPMLPPVLVREEAMYGTGFFPTDAVNIYGVERDQLYLVGTSEVPAAAFHAGEFSRNYRSDTWRTPPASGVRPAPRARTLAACSACTSSTRWRCSCTACRRPQARSTKGCSRLRKGLSRSSACRTA
jgi:seryl-tRNA synthetase